MNESKYPPLLTIEEIEDGTQLIGTLSPPLNGVAFGDNVAEVLNKAAHVVGAYQATHSYEARIAEIDRKMQELQIERRALVDAGLEVLPIYSLLDDAELEYYAANTKGINPGYINWYEEKYGKKIIAIYLIANPFENRYGGLTWQWVVVDSKDSGDRGNDAATT